MSGRIEEEQRIFENIEKKIEHMPTYVKKYYAQLKRYGMSSKSCQMYIDNVCRYLAFINKSIIQIPVTQINDETVGDYIVASRYTKNGKRETSASHQRSVIIVLRSFTKFLYDNHYVDYQVSFEDYKVRKHDNPERPELTEKDFKKILDTVRNGIGSDRAKKVQRKLKNRDLAIFEVFMFTGMREGELVRINVSDIDFEKGTLVVEGKDGKTHRYKLPYVVLDQILKWEQDKIDYEMKTEKTNDALFINRSGNRMREIGVSEMVARYSEVALGYKISPHKLRAGFCTILYRKTKDIKFVCDVVGHSDVSITQRYIVGSKGDKEKANAIMMQSIF